MRILSLFAAILVVSSCSTQTTSTKEADRKSVSQQDLSWVDRTLAGELYEDTKERPRPIGEGFLRPHKGPSVTKWINYFTNSKGRRTLEIFLERGAKYRATIEEILEQHGLPKGLYFVGMIESGYNLTARSKAGATGPWQFMKSKAGPYGLRITSLVDERRDLIKATQAAAKLFIDLYNIFGSWELALSSYNQGEYGLIRRIRKANTRDYYELAKLGVIPRETRNYVPKTLAVMEIVHNPEKYGFTIPKNAPAAYHDTTLVRIKRSYRLRDLARNFGLTEKELRSLNPELISSRTPKRHYLRIPESKGPRLASVTNLAPVKEKRRSKPKVSAKRQKNRVVVRRGDNLWEIARRHKVKVSELRRWNDLNGKKIFVGQRLKISGPEHKAPVVKKKIVKQHYRVRPGDNLYDLAQRFELRVRELVRLNGLKSTTIHPGQKLVVKRKKSTFYVVQKGDYLEKIAGMFNKDVRRLKELNELRKSTIYPGQKLLVSQ